MNHVIKKHENTREDKEIDRITHVDTCSAQTGPIFLAYRSDKGIHDIVASYVENETPIYDFTAVDGIAHRVWKIAKKEDVDDAVFETEEHMRQVLDVVLNQSYTKLGMQNGKGRTYEGILTVGSIAKAQRYYELLKRIKAGKDALKINEEICKVVPDFPKFAITYSVTENDEASTVNQDKMRESLQDYNGMFGTHYDIENINAYNSNLNDRLARKEKRYM